MSDITTVILLMAVGLGHTFVTLALDRRMLDDVEMIVTGTTPSGVPVPSSHRHIIFSRYLGFYGNIIMIDLAVGVGYWLVGQNTDFRGAAMAGVFCLLSCPWVSRCTTSCQRTCGIATFDPPCARPKQTDRCSLTPHPSTVPSPGRA